MKKPNFSSIPFENLRFSSDLSNKASQKSYVTNEQIEVKDLYKEEDIQNVPFLPYMPGIAPYHRGPYPTMYITRPWTVRQYAGFSTAEESNAFYRRNLAAGQKGLSVAFVIASNAAATFSSSRFAFSS